MRVLISADWHLGRQGIGGVDLTSYQKELLLSWFLDELVLKLRPEVLIVAGDIFDSKRPSAEALSLFSEFVNAIADLRLPAVFLAGNHDLPELVTYMEGILSRHGLHMISAANWSEKNVIVDLPGLIFLPHLSVYRREGRSMEEILEDLASRYDPANSILITHLTILGSVQEAWDEWEIGFVPIIPANMLRAWKLVVSGHLHGHHMPASNVVYPGSLLKYHPQEKNQKKTVLLVDTETGQWEALSVPQKIDMLEVAGYWDKNHCQFVIEDLYRAPSGDTDFLVLVTLSRPGGDLSLAKGVISALEAEYPGVKFFFGKVHSIAHQLANESSAAPTQTLVKLSPQRLVHRFLQEHNLLESIPIERINVIVDEIFAAMEENYEA